MASEAKNRALSRGNAAIPRALLRVLSDFMSDLEVEILAGAVKRAEARSRSNGRACVSSDDVHKAAAALLADAPESFAKHLREQETLHERRHAS